MISRQNIINNAMPVKVFADELGLYDNFYRNIKEFRNGFKLVRVGAGFFVVLPEWFLELLELGYQCYAVKPYDDFKFSFKVSITKKTELGFFKL